MYKSMVAPPLQAVASVVYSTVTERGGWAAIHATRKIAGDGFDQRPPLPFAKRYRSDVVAKLEALEIVLKMTSRCESVGGLVRM